MTDINGFAEALKKTNLHFYLISLGLIPVSILIRSYKWQLLLNVQGAKLSLLKIQVINYMSLFFNNFFLGTFGGDAFRSHKTMHSSSYRSGSVSAVIMDRLTGIWVLVLIVLISAVCTILTNQPIIGQGQSHLIIGVCLLVLSSSFTLFYLLSKFYKITRRIKFPRVVSIMQNIITSLRTYKYHKNILFFSFLLSFSFHVTHIISMYFCSLAANVHVNFIHWAMVVPLISFMVMIPISANGLGVQEGAVYLYLDRIGVDPASALLIAILPRIGMLLVSLIGALFYVCERHYDSV